MQCTVPDAGFTARARDHCSRTPVSTAALQHVPLGTVGIPQQYGTANEPRDRACSPMAVVSAPSSENAAQQAGQGSTAAGCTRSSDTRTILVRRADGRRTPAGKITAMPGFQSPARQELPAAAAGRTWSGSFVLQPGLLQIIFTDRVKDVERPAPFFHRNDAVRHPPRNNVHVPWTKHAFFIA